MHECCGANCPALFWSRHGNYNGAMLLITGTKCQNSGTLTTKMKFATGIYVARQEIGRDRKLSHEKTVMKNSKMFTMVERTH